MPKFKKQAVVFLCFFAIFRKNLTACPLASNQRKYQRIFGGLSALLSLIY
ncbi:hypothetical protein X781_19630 [Mannheimia sp. USDA-ARS-USMARC-1261]|nr:hypothetical protein X781_19630 [Mannheimia sp. USDA-ARS-USMARC-1261]